LAHRFRAAFDVIAIGDEDVVTSERAQAIRDQMGAVCVAGKAAGRRVRLCSTASVCSKSAP